MIVNFKLRRSGMKKRIQTLLTALLITMVAVPAYAALYDASGRWLIEAVPDQTVSILGVTIDIPDAWLWATVDQSETGDTFSMVTDEIEGLGGISYSGAGTIEDSTYTFVPVMTETVELGTIPGYEQYASYGISFTVSLSGFELISQNGLEGEFEIGETTIGFTGTRAVAPLPAAVWFMGTGMMGLLGLRRRYRA